jgi:hypothetical protein
MTVVFDLLADLLVAPPAPAKAANPANREYSWGLQADSAPANPVRILASSTLPPDPYSQTFATLRSHQSTPQSKGTHGDSQDSQDSQGVPATAPVRACKGCAHLLRRGICGEPLAAGLLTAGEGFGIVWPPEGYGAGCPAFIGKIPTAVPDLPHSLKIDQANRCHSHSWDDAEMAAFTARTERFALQGLAERLLRRDRSGDHRRLCTECTHARPGWRCAKGEAVLADQLQACPLFKEH